MKYSQSGTAQIQDITFLDREIDADSLWGKEARLDLLLELRASPTRLRRRLAGGLQLLFAQLRNRHDKTPTPSRFT